MKASLGYILRHCWKKQNKAKNYDLDVSWTLRVSLSEAPLEDSKMILFNKPEFTSVLIYTCKLICKKIAILNLYKYHLNWYS